MNSKKKIAVLFPGIGYTCDKPLLYYAGKLAAAEGYKVLPVPYKNFPPNVKGDPAKMHQCFETALVQSREILKDIDWTEYDEILFISKSIGTIVSNSYAMEHNLKVRSILYTPLSQTFLYPLTDAVVFHGTSDPWAVTSEIQDGCKIYNLPLYLTPGGNHSLETGDVKKDLQALQSAMDITEAFISSTI